jgi:hypothetical protein
MIGRTVRLLMTSLAWLAATAALAQQPPGPPQPTSDAAAAHAPGPIEFGCEPAGTMAGKSASDQEPGGSTYHFVSEIPARGYWYDGCVPAGHCSCRSRGLCGRFVDCFCRCCCGSFTYAACGGPRAAANCCDGCSPPLILPGMFDGCCGCDECCGCNACITCPEPRCSYVRNESVLEKQDFDVATCDCNREVKRLPTCQDCGYCDADGPACADSDIIFDSGEGPRPAYADPGE